MQPCRYDRVQQIRRHLSCKRTVHQFRADIGFREVFLVHRSKNGNLAETFSDEKREERMKEELERRNSRAQNFRVRSGDIFDIRLSLADEEGVMFSTKGYAAHSAHEPLKPFSFDRREPTPTDVPDRTACLLGPCLPMVASARAYIQPGLRPARSCICPSASCRKNASLSCGKHLSRG